MENDYYFQKWKQQLGTDQQKKFLQAKKGDKYRLYYLLLPSKP